jgi:hypothetical protein
MAIGRSIGDECLRQRVSERGKLANQRGKLRAGPELTPHVAGGLL